jgi:hypothetical protein
LISLRDYVAVEVQGAELSLVRGKDSTNQDCQMIVVVVVVVVASVGVWPDVVTSIVEV